MIADGKRMKTVKMFKEYAEKLGSRDICEFCFCTRRNPINQK